MKILNHPLNYPKLLNSDDIRSKLRSEEYKFLRDHEHLGKNIILLTLGGSYAYGTALPGSDLDIRGCAVSSKYQILTGNHFEQVIDNATDTTIYSLYKLLSLLENCNPNTIEILGCRPQDYFYISPIGQKLIDNRKLFLSKKACNSFGGYASQQLYRLNQKCIHQISQSDLEKHILKTLSAMQETFPEKYATCSDDAINLYIDKAVQEGYDTEIFMDIHLSHYPLRDYCSMWSELQNTVKSYGKIGRRNERALEHGKIAKHMMHLVRLYGMCLDILEKEEINTYRIKEHDLLMDIRAGKFLDENDNPIPEFYEMVRDYEKQLSYAKENTSLPQEADHKKIMDLAAEINEQIVCGQDIDLQKEDTELI